MLGIDDAYGPKKRNMNPAPVTKNEVPDDDVMRNNGRVTTNDIEMMWEAWRTNKWQLFVDYKGQKKSKVILSY